VDIPIIQNQAIQTDVLDRARRCANDSRVEPALSAVGHLRRVRLEVGLPNWLARLAAMGEVEGSACALAAMRTVNSG